MPESVPDWIITVAAVLIMYAAVLYAVGCHLTGKWRRRHRILPAAANPVYLRRAELAARLEREQHVAGHAERIVAAEYQRVAALYEEPTESAPSN